MPECSSKPVPKPVRLCDASALEESGRGLRFEVCEFGRTVPAFALRFEGQAVAYLNRCAHVATEMDWQPGEFLDDQKQWILCSVHGAVYDPRDGVCVAGPCVRARLRALKVDERDGVVYWYPDERFQPVPTGG